MATAKKEKAPPVTFPLHEAVALVVAKHESQAEAARQFDVGKAYLSRLLSGVKTNPSDDVLKRMGIKRQVTTIYTVPGTRRPAGQSL